VYPNENRTFDFNNERKSAAVVSRNGKKFQYVKILSIRCINPAQIGQLKIAGVVIGDDIDSYYIDYGSFRVESHLRS
jgi:hypothetical protein